MMSNNMDFNKLNKEDLYKAVHGVYRLKPNEILYGFKKVFCDVKDSHDKIHTKKKCLVSLEISGENRPIVKTSHHYSYCKEMHTGLHNIMRKCINHDYYKLRTDQARVISIVPHNISGHAINAYSAHDPSFKYEEGKTVCLKPDENLDTNDITCSHGINFFLGLDEAYDFKI